MTAPLRWVCVCDLRRLCDATPTTTLCVMHSPEEIQPGVWLIHAPGSKGPGDFRIDLGTSSPVMSFTNESVALIVSAIFGNEERLHPHPGRRGGMMFLSYLVSETLGDDVELWERFDKDLRRNGVVSNENP